MQREDILMATDKAEPKGLGGWLILPLIGLIVSPIRMAISLNNDFLPIFQEGYWEVLTTPGSEAYHHLWGPLITFEIVGNLLFIVFALILIFLFFTKAPIFPSLFIIYIIANLLYVVGDFFFANLIPAVASESDPGSIKELFRTAVGAAIWIPYFKMSKRVKNTFVKHTPQHQLQLSKANSV